jgi:hypothetical protein
MTEIFFFFVRSMTEMTADKDMSQKLTKLHKLAVVSSLQAKTILILVRMRARNGEKVVTENLV